MEGKQYNLEYPGVCVASFPHCAQDLVGLNLLMALILNGFSPLPHRLFRWNLSCFMSLY
jgi:hypothetical protein